MQKTRRHTIHARLREFVLPPIDDGIVLGRESPIGHVAIARALDLLSTIPYEHIPIEDEVIGDVLVRAALLRKLSADEIRAFVLREVKPHMGPEEIIHLELQVELLIETDGA